MNNNQTQQTNDKMNDEDNNNPTEEQNDIIDVNNLMNSMQVLLY